MVLVSFFKVLGIDQIPPNRMLLFNEFKNATFNVQQDKISINVSFGDFGANNEERTQISRGMHSDERENYIESGSPVPAIIASIEHEFSCGPAKVLKPDEQERHQMEDELRPLTRTAWKALNEVLVSIRKRKYDDWKTTRFPIVGFLGLTRPFEFGEFEDGLFYKVTEGNCEIVGFADQTNRSWLQKGSYMYRPPDSKEIAKIQGIIDDGIPVSIRLILLAWEQHFDGDYRMAVINAEIALENELDEFAATRLSEELVASKTAIDGFVKETRSKYLLDIVLPMLDIWSNDTIDGCKKIFDLRNQVMHAPRMNISEKDSEEAIQTVESFRQSLDMIKKP